MEFELGFTPNNLEMALDILKPVLPNQTKASIALFVQPRQLRRYMAKKNAHTMPHEKWLIIVELLKQQKEKTNASLKRTATARDKKAISNAPQLF